MSHLNQLADSVEDGRLALTTEVHLNGVRRIFAVNVLAHVHATRAVLPSMLERGRGHLMTVASAAGLLTTPGDAPYTVTKHEAVAFAEWLAVTYGDRGIGASVVCPLGVATPLLLDRWRRAHPGVRGRGVGRRDLR